MFFKQGKISREDQDRLALHKETTFFESDFNFLKQHNGFRPADKHLFIAPTGGGKSTLRNSIIVDLMKNPQAKILLYLSEESSEKFQTDIATGLRDVVDLSRINIISETDLEAEGHDFTDRESVAEEIKLSILQTKSNVFIFDNLTTSAFYGEVPKDQQRAFNFMSNLGKSIKFAGIYFAHTTPGLNRYNKKLQDTDDIRGTRMTVNKSEYAYSVQQFQISDRESINNGLNTLINCVKTRDYNKKNDFFIMAYSRQKRIYVKDSAVDFDIVKRLFNEKDSL